MNKNHFINYKKIFLFSFFLSISILINAQTKWEQLEATLKDSSEPATLKFYMSAAKDNFFSNRKQSERFASKAYAISLAGNQYINEKGDMSNLLGVISMYNANYDASDKYLKDALLIAKQENNEVLKLKALGNLALNSSKKGAYQQAIVQIFELIPLLEKKGDKLGMANNYANLSNAYFYLEQLKNAEIYQLKALDLFRELNYKQGVGNAMNTLGSIYSDKKDFKRAIYYLEKAEAYKKNLNDSTGLANIYINMFELYTRLNNKEAGFKALQKSEKLFKELKDNEGMAKVYTNMGTYYYNLKEYKTAVDYQNKSIQFARKGKDAYVLNIAYENIAKTYSYLNRPDSAISFNTKAKVAKDSLLDFDLQKKISETEIKYQTEKKEKLIGQQQLLLKAKQLTIVRRNYLIGIASAMLLLVISVSYFLSRQNKLKNKAHLQNLVMHQQQLSTKAVLEAEENERIRIAKDLHDGIGQMMSVAKMNLSSIEYELDLDADKKLKMDRVIGLVDESCKEIRSVSHNLMPNALLKAGLAAAVREFIDKIDHHSLQIDIHSEGLNERLDADTETVLYRVIQESVNNVIKHSAANHLDVSLINDADGISVTVEDNGRGFNTNEIEQFNGIGLKNMKTRIEYLKGTIEWNSKPGKGTLVAMHIPVKNNSKTS
ncbi:MAG: sensor histidine kinase [Ferruginibacter sp.]